jgi:perosamine synthetase
MIGQPRPMIINQVETGFDLPSDQNASGRSLGAEELDLLAQVIASGVLTSTKGEFVRTFEQQFASALGVKHAFACASGTAAIHAAIAAIDPEPGDEIVTTSITDMGALTPILYQAAIPVFAEVDPETYNVTAETIESCLSKRTKAIIVTHLFGNSCEMDRIMRLARNGNIPVLEDCAQAFLTTYQDRYVGTIGKIGCFSLQQGKHITTGEGGIVVTDDDAIARRLFLFINKGWGYGDVDPDHYFLALNYRMTELQGAVAVAQLPKLQAAVSKRTEAADRMRFRLRNLPGIENPRVTTGCTHTYWKYCLRVDEDVIPGGASALADRLKSRNISCTPRYIQKPAFMCKIFQDQKTFGHSRFPFTLARPEAVDYNPHLFPLTLEALNGVLVLPWNENYMERHLDYVANGIIDCVSELCG